MKMLRTNALIGLLSLIAVGGPWSPVLGEPRQGARDSKSGYSIKVDIAISQKQDYFLVTLLNKKHSSARVDVGVRVGKVVRKGERPQLVFSEKEKGVELRAGELRSVRIYCDPKTFKHWRKYDAQADVLRSGNQKWVAKSAKLRFKGKSR